MAFSSLMSLSRVVRRKMTSTVLRSTNLQRFLPDFLEKKSDIAENQNRQMLQTASFTKDQLQTASLFGLWEVTKAQSRSSSSSVGEARGGLLLLHYQKLEAIQVIRSQNQTRSFLPFSEVDEEGVRRGCSVTLLQEKARTIQEKFEPENEDLVLSDPSSDEDSPALASYNRTRISSVNEASPSSSLAKGMHKTDSFQQVVDDDEGLGRPVALFPLALQNFEKLLKSAAKNKSEETHLELGNVVKSHIITEPAVALFEKKLKSAAKNKSEETHLVLGNVKSHFITEPEKTSNVAKTMGKPAETRSQGTSHQKLITLFEGGIHTKLNNSVYKKGDEGMKTFKSTNEGLEAKGSTEKQRTSHQKLSAHFEGGIIIQTKLNNSVYMSGRGNMMQLKMRALSMQIRCFAYKPEMPEFPTVEIAHYNDLTLFLMKIKAYRPTYGEVNRKGAKKEHLKLLDLANDYDRKAAEAEERKDEAEQLEYKKKALEILEDAMVEIEFYRRIERFKIFCRAREIDFIKEKKEKNQ